MNAPLRRHIRLSEVIDRFAPLTDDYPPKALAAASAALIARGLTFDNLSGEMIEADDVVECFSDPADFAPHSSEDDVMIWEFSRYIRNSASRIERGFAP